MNSCDKAHIHLLQTSKHVKASLYKLSRSLCRLVGLGKTCLIGERQLGLNRAQTPTSVSSTSLHLQSCRVTLFHSSEQVSSAVKLSSLTTKFCQNPGAQDPPYLTANRPNPHNSAHVRRRSLIRSGMNVSQQRSLRQLRRNLNNRLLSVVNSFTVSVCTVMFVLLVNVNFSENATRFQLPFL